jgi:hypothetical protein
MKLLTSDRIHGQNPQVSLGSHLLQLKTKLRGLVPTGDYAVAVLLKDQARERRGNGWKDFPYK